MQENYLPVVNFKRFVKMLNKEFKPPLTRKYKNERLFKGRRSKYVGTILPLVEFSIRGTHITGDARQIGRIRFPADSFFSGEFINLLQYHDCKYLVTPLYDISFFYKSYKSKPEKKITSEEKKRSKRIQAGYPLLKFVPYGKENTNTWYVQTRVSKGVYADVVILQL